MDLFANSSAVISPCGRYRYRLERDGPGEGRTVIIMVNPSTADAETDDATIRKLKGFGARNGWGRIIVGKGKWRDEPMLEPGEDCLIAVGHHSDLRLRYIADGPTFEIVGTVQ